MVCGLNIYFSEWSVIIPLLASFKIISRVLDKARAEAFAALLSVDGARKKQKNPFR